MKMERRICTIHHRLEAIQLNLITPMEAVDHIKVNRGENIEIRG